MKSALSSHRTSVGAHLTVYHPITAVADVAREVCPDVVLPSEETYS
jgi:hypothetical protein